MVLNNLKSEDQARIVAIEGGRGIETATVAARYIGGEHYQGGLFRWWPCGS